MAADEENVDPNETTPQRTGNWTQEELSDPKKKLYYTTSDFEKKANGKFKCFQCSYENENSGNMTKHVLFRHPRFHHIRDPAWSPWQKEKAGENVCSGNDKQLEDELTDPNKKLPYSTAELERVDGRYKCILPKSCPYDSPCLTNVIKHINTVHPQFVHQPRPRSDRYMGENRLGIKTWTKAELSETNKKLFFTTDNLEKEKGKFKCFCCSMAATCPSNVVKHITTQHPRFVHTKRTKKPKGKKPRIDVPRGLASFLAEDLSDPNKILFFKSENLEKKDGKFRCFCCPQESKDPWIMIRHIARMHPRFVHKSRTKRKNGKMPDSGSAEGGAHFEGAKAERSRTKHPTRKDASIIALFRPHVGAQKVARDPPLVDLTGCTETGEEDVDEETTSEQTFSDSEMMDDLEDERLYETEEWSDRFSSDKHSVENNLTEAPTYVEIHTPADSQDDPLDAIDSTNAMNDSNSEAHNMSIEFLEVVEKPSLNRKEDAIGNSGKKHHPSVVFKDHEYISQHQSENEHFYTSSPKTQYNRETIKVVWERNQDPQLISTIDNSHQHNGQEVLEPQRQFNSEIIKEQPIRYPVLIKNKEAQNSHQHNGQEVLEPQRQFNSEIIKEQPIRYPVLIKNKEAQSTTGDMVPELLKQLEFERTNVRNSEQVIAAHEQEIEYLKYTMEEMQKEFELEIEKAKGREELLANKNSTNGQEKAELQRQLEKEEKRVQILENIITGKENDYQNLVAAAGEKESDLTLQLEFERGKVHNLAYQMTSGMTEYSILKSTMEEMQKQFERERERAQEREVALTKKLVVAEDTLKKCRTIYVLKEKEDKLLKEQEEEEQRLNEVQKEHERVMGVLEEKKRAKEERQREMERIQAELSVIH